MMSPVLRYLLLFFGVLFSMFTYAQQTMPADKIDPSFKVLIEQQQAKTTAKKKCFLKKKDKSATATTTAADAKKYDCIVYTKNAKALRDKKITVNSELPTFVTASVTLAQIVLMSNMAEVTYIAAPETATMH